MRRENGASCRVPTVVIVCYDVRPLNAKNRKCDCNVCEYKRRSTRANIMPSRDSELFWNLIRFNLCVWLVSRDAKETVNWEIETETDEKTERQRPVGMTLRK